jgi:hypothetical protein
MEQLFDSLSRTLATATSRRDALRMVFGALFGGVVASACASPTKPSCSADECLGTDNACYGPCPSGSYCTSNPGNANCSRPTSGGVYCCTTSTGGGNKCQAGNCWIRSAFVCCPNGYLNYAGAGYGCYSTQAACLNASGGKCWYETSCIP